MITIESRPEVFAQPLERVDDSNDGNGIHKKNVFEPDDRDDENHVNGNYHENGDCNKENDQDGNIAASDTATATRSEGDEDFPIVEEPLDNSEDKEKEEEEKKEEGSQVIVGEVLLNELDTSGQSEGEVNVIVDDGSDDEPLSSFIGKKEEEKGDDDVEPLLAEINEVAQESVAELELIEASPETVVEIVVESVKSTEEDIETTQTDQTLQKTGGTRLGTPVPKWNIRSRRGIRDPSPYADFGVRSEPSSPNCVDFPKLKKYGGREQLNNQSFDVGRKRPREGTPDQEPDGKKPRQITDWLQYVNPFRLWSQTAAEGQVEANEAEKSRCSLM